MTSNANPPDLGKCIVELDRRISRVSRYVVPPQDADDVRHDLVVRLLENPGVVRSLLPGGRRHHYAAAYLFVCLRHLWRDALKEKSRLRLEVEPPENWSLDSVADGKASDRESWETLDDLAESIQAIDRRLLTVLLRKAFQRLPTAEACKGIMPLRTHQRKMRSLRQLLEKKGYRTTR